MEDRRMATKFKRATEEEKKLEKSKYRKTLSLHAEQFSRLELITCQEENKDLYQEFFDHAAHNLLVRTGMHIKGEKRKI